jgi:5-methylcytosine-specific restriction protein B
LGYGEVISDYYFDNSKPHYQKFRKVKWIKKGTWKTDHDLALKTLTNITAYPSDIPGVDHYYERLLKLMDEKVPESNVQKDTIKYPLNTIFYGPPGTGKTYNTILRSAQIIRESPDVNFLEAQKIFNDNLGSQIEFITFHQNYSYEDFIQGLRPDIDNETDLRFERKDGIFKKIADRALKNLIDSERSAPVKQGFAEVFNDFIAPLINEEIEELIVPMKRVSFYINNITNKSIDFRKSSGDSKHSLSIETLRKMYDKGTNDLIIGGLQPYYNSILSLLLEKGKISSEKVSKKNYVLIIDEINRANISRVFGELITLIECDKRSHGSIPMKCALPSGEDFMVPSNLYLIGTMNTADKSIALLDIALRRRFDFEPMYPLYNIEGHKIHDVDILKKINEKIRTLKGCDFQIGHAYFMDNTISLAERMNKRVIPLLLEYFMNDETEVKGILSYAGLSVEADSWPLKISNND